MTTMTLDTHAIIKRLTAAKMPEEQAELIIDAINQSREDDVGKLATKSDLREVELRLNGEITLLKWMMGLVIAGILALVLKAYVPH